MKSKTIQRERQRFTSVLLKYSSQSLENPLKFEFMRSRYFSLTRWPGGKMKLFQTSRRYFGRVWPQRTHICTWTHRDTQCLVQQAPGRPVQCRAAVVCQSHVGWGIVWLVASWLAGVTGITVPIDSGAGFVLAVLSAEKQYYAGWESSEPTLARDPERGGVKYEEKIKTRSTGDDYTGRKEYSKKEKDRHGWIFLINRT